MSNSSFSSLIYRIIGKPQRWHDDYIVEIMQQYLDVAEENGEPNDADELEAGDQIISRLQQGNVALTAFNTLLDKSRFQMIILDDKLNLVYHNRNAEPLFSYLKDSEKPTTIKPALATLIRAAPVANTENKQNSLLALDYQDANGDQIYLRSIQSQVKEHNQPNLFHILMVLDEQHANKELNPELVSRYGFTEKEQNVLVRLVHGSSIREIATASFVSENTVKTHLRSIFAKTGSRSQGALISLILTHESQVLDSYFDSDITTTGFADNSEYDREITLTTGETITYCDYGPRDGRPLIVFHSGFGSRLAIPPGFEVTLKKHNRRVIIPDRPGIGKTDYIQGHPQNWNKRLNEIIERLGIEQYDLLGSVIACQMAMSFAAQADARLYKVILTSPVFLNEESDTQYLTEILAPAARYVRLSAQFAMEIYELWLKSVTLNLDAHYPSMLDGSIGSAERTLFEKQNMTQLLTNVFKEGARQSLDGILHEMVFCMTPLNLELDEFDKPLEVWFGTEDKRITEAGVHAIFSRFKDCKLHIREGYSEHLYYALFEEIIA